MTQNAANNDGFSTVQYLYGVRFADYNFKLGLHGGIVDYSWSRRQDTNESQLHQENVCSRHHDVVSGLILSGIRFDLIDFSRPTLLYSAKYFIGECEMQNDCDEVMKCYEVTSVPC